MIIIKCTKKAMLFQIGILILETVVNNTIQSIPNPHEIPCKFLCVCLNGYDTVEKCHRFYLILKGV